MIQPETIIVVPLLLSGHLLSMANSLGEIDSFQGVI